MTDAPTAPAGERCPPDELLIALLVTDLSGPERAGVDAHLNRCDHCVETLTVVQHRLSLATEVARPVPSALARRVLEHFPVPAGQPTAADRTSSGRAPLWERITGWLRFPVLVPLGVAAAAALLVGHTVLLRPDVPRERSRSIQLHQTVRVSATEAIVRRQPTTRGESVATLHRGAVVTVTGEDREWYRIALPNGTGGWVERSAFE
jgi:hypothetical protein